VRRSAAGESLATARIINALPGHASPRNSVQRTGDAVHLRSASPNESGAQRQANPHDGKARGADCQRRLPSPCGEPTAGAPARLVGASGERFPGQMRSPRPHPPHLPPTPPAIPRMMVATPQTASDTVYSLNMVPDTFYSLVPDTSYSPFIPLLFRTCYSALWGIFGRAVCIVLCFASAGCCLFQPTPTPVMNGSWDGVLRLVTVLDEDEVRHDVLGVLLVDEIHVTGDSRGGGYDAKNDTSWFWMFWPHERVALLVDKQLRLLRPGEIAESVDDHVIFRGTPRFLHFSAPLRLCGSTTPQNAP
jgi:hypothetical protein